MSSSEQSIVTRKWEFCTLWVSGACAQKDYSMPGFSICVDCGRDIREENAQLQEALNKTNHFEHYENRVLLANANCFLAATTYEAYPVARVENDEYLVYLEGVVYENEPPTIEDRMLEFASLLFDETSSAERRLEQLLHRTDGEFVVFAQEKTSGNIAFVNDLLGHLPVFYSHSGTRLLLSREFSFVSHLLGDRRFDLHGIAQTLLLRYTIDCRTLLGNVRRLPPATYVRVRLNDRRVDFRTVFRLCLEPRKHARKGNGDVHEMLSQHLVDGCRRRCESHANVEHVLSLSGGLDSRLVVAALQECDPQYVMRSWTTDSPQVCADVEAAKLLSEILAREWTLDRLSPPAAENAAQVVCMHGGMISVSLSELIPWMAHVRASYAPGVVLFTGATGVNLRAYKPLHKMRDSRDILDALTSSGVLGFDPADVAALLGLSLNEIKDVFASYFHQCPEQSLEHKYDHFIQEGRGWAWHYLGMDRQRAFCWPIHILESNSFAVNVLHCSASQKRQFALHRGILATLAPELLRVPYAPYGSSVSSPSFRLKLLTVELVKRMPQPIKSLLRSVGRVSSSNLIAQDASWAHHTGWHKCITKQLQSSDTVASVFSPIVLDKLIHKTNRSQTLALATVVSAVESFEGNTNTLLDLSDELWS